jgi:aryl-alcohol dehydrogenase-like predicted oxidoreductase
VQLDNAVRSLGPDGPPVSAIGLGAMALSVKDRPPEGEAIRLVHCALDEGVSIIDTADLYALTNDEVGHNERLIGKALATWSGCREKIVVATKGGLTRTNGGLRPNGHPRYLRQACERSLRSLGADAIDLYQLHAVDPKVPFADSIGTLRDLRDEGKVRWIGLSNVGVELIRTARRIVAVCSVQNEFSVFRRESAATGMIARIEELGIRHIRQLRRLIGEPLASGVVAYCAREGLGFLAYSPLGGRRSIQLAAHPVLRRIAAAHGTSPHAVAIAWTMAQSPVVIPIPSARSVEHLKDSLSASGLELTALDMTAIAEAKFMVG